MPSALFNEADACLQKPTRSFAAISKFEKLKILRVGIPVYVNSPWAKVKNADISFNEPEAKARTLSTFKRFFAQNPFHPLQSLQVVFYGSESSGVRWRSTIHRTQPTSTLGPGGTVRIVKYHVDAIREHPQL